MISGLSIICSSTGDSRVISSTRTLEWRAAAIYEKRAESKKTEHKEILKERFEGDKTRIFYGGLPFVAGPDRTADMIEELVVGGDIDGVMFTFPDFRAGAERFGETVMPLLRKRGIVPRPAAAA